MTVRAGFRWLTGILLTLLICLGLGGCGDGPEPAATPSESPEESTATEQPLLPQLPERPDYEDVRVYYDGLLADRGYTVDGSVYLDPALMCEMLGVDLENAADAERFRIKLSGISLTGERGKEYFQADYRYLYAPNGWLTVNGRALLPTDVFDRVFGVGITVSDDSRRVDVDTGNARLLKCAENYYRSHFTHDDIYWLAHIINAEATNQPLAGKIGVGNVVLNRVKYEYFPNSVYEVIFQRDNGDAQFTPIDNGAINQAPNEESLIAAYLCLDGYNTVGDSMFFVNPTAANSSWFEKWKTFVITIGDHDFYA